MERTDQNRAAGSVRARRTRHRLTDPGVLVSLLVILALGVSACASGATPTPAPSAPAATATPGSTGSGPTPEPTEPGPATGEPYVLGFTSDFSSNFGYLGLGLKAGLDAYFDARNARGGIDNHPVRLIALDDMSQADRGVANVTQLITQQKAIAIMGVMYSVICSAAVPVLTQYKVPEMCGVVSKDLVDPVNPWVYATTVQQAAYAAPQVELARQLMAEKKPGQAKIKVAVIYSVGSAAIEQWATAVEENVATLGWDLVDIERVPITAIDMSAEMTKIIASEPDVMILGAGNNAWVLAAMKQLAGAGNPFPVVSYDVPSWSTVKEINSAYYYYVTSLAYAPPNPTTPGLIGLVTDTAAQNIDPNGPYVIRGYLQAMIVSDALERCGFPCTGEQLQAALDETDFDAGGIIDGAVKLSPDNHEPVFSMAAYQWDLAHTAPIVVATGLEAGTKIDP